MCSLAATPLTSAASITLEAFTQNVQREVIQGSAIAPSLYESGMQILTDTILQAGGDVSYPIHEALNWRVTRFGRQVRQTQYAAIFQNEDQSCWQAKLYQPIWDQSQQKARKYETPMGAGARAYFPSIPLAIRQKIADRYGMAVPKAGSFWQWVTYANIPIVLTEGAKKALSLMSQGYVAIALYGVNGG
jgi:Domain of unknown function (DUF3854)